MIKIIPDNLITARSLRGFTQAKLGEIVGVNYQQILRYETGRSNPRPAILKKLAVALDTTARWLTAGEASFIDHADGDTTFLIDDIPPDVLEFIELRAKKDGITGAEVVSTLVKKAMIDDLRDKLAHLESNASLKSDR